ncbi:hypothetical protein SDC9_132553 [bioreactor metagenome]|uniref:Sec translocon accessory complex subunit YajC n=1 Tax=bioreactor metagenome TaxID=1076179 RepID=A0A645DA29_9ZZZZ
MDQGTLTILMLVAFFAVYYFLLIRPQKKKEKQIKEMRNSISVGDSITTIGGFMGKVVTVKDDYFVIECGADKNKLNVAKWGVATKDSEEKE